MAQTAIETMGGDDFFLVIMQIQQMVEKMLEDEKENKELKCIQGFCKQYAKDGLSVFQLVPGDMEKDVREILVKKGIQFGPAPTGRGDVMLMVHPSNQEQLIQAIQYARDKNPRYSSQLKEEEIVKTNDKVLLLDLENQKNKLESKNMGYLLENKELVYEILSNSGTPVSKTTFDGEKLQEGEAGRLLFTTSSCKNGLLEKGFLELVALNALYSMGDKDKLVSARKNESIIEKEEVDQFMKNVTEKPQKDCFLSAGMGGNMQVSFSAETQKVTIERYVGNQKETLLDIPISQLQDIAKKDGRSWETLLKNKLLDATKDMTLGVCFTYDENSPLFKDKMDFEKQKENMLFSREDADLEAKRATAKGYTEKQFEDRKAGLPEGDKRLEAYKDAFQGRGEEFALEKRFGPFERALLQGIREQFKDNKINDMEKGLGQRFEKIRDILSKDTPFVSDLLKDASYEVTTEERIAYIENLRDSCEAFAEMKLQEVPSQKLQDALDEQSKKENGKDEKEQQQEKTQESDQEQGQEQDEEEQRQNFLRE